MGRGSPYMPSSPRTNGDLSLVRRRRVPSVQTGSVRTNHARAVGHRSFTWAYPYRAVAKGWPASIAVVFRIGGQSLCVELKHHRSKGLPVGVVPLGLLLQFPKELLR